MIIHDWLSRERARAHIFNTRVIRRERKREVTDEEETFGRSAWKSRAFEHPRNEPVNPLFRRLTRLHNIDP